MTGYDKEPSYGGPPVTKWTYIGIIIGALIMAGLALWALT